MVYDSKINRFEKYTLFHESFWYIYLKMFLLQSYMAKCFLTKLIFGVKNRVVNIIYIDYKEVKMVEEVKTINSLNLLISILVGLLNLQSNKNVRFDLI